METEIKRLEKIKQHIRDSYYSCLHGDYRCYDSCPMLEQCWLEEAQSEVSPENIISSAEVKLDASVV